MGTTMGKKEFEKYVGTQPKQVRYFNGKRYLRAVSSNNKAHLKQLGENRKKRLLKSKTRRKEASYRIVPASKEYRWKYVLYERSDRCMDLG